MDFARPVPDVMREDFNDSVRKRLETFQFRRSNVSTVGMTPLSQSLPGGQRGSHVRNGSSSSLAFSTSTNSIISTISDSSSTSDSRPMSTSGPKSRPTSHHRRRSSVSTRVESAEMMGVDVVTLPPSSSDDNVNFGDKDSIRRRALLALEGKGGFDPRFSMVEIPELVSSKTQGSMDAFSKPSVPSFGPPSLAGKRDSFGKLVSTGSSLKDQLHTLLEVEEEEEEEAREDTTFSNAWTPQKFSDFPSSSEGSISERSEEAFSSIRENDFEDSSFSSDSPELMVISSSPLPVRHRPTSLALRPLTLTPNSSHTTLPTPSLTPSPRPLALRKLSLTPSTDPDGSQFFQDDDSFGNVKHAPRDNLVRSPSPSQPSSFMSRPAPNGSSTPSSTASRSQGRTSYIRRGRSSSQAAIFTTAGLPTPDGTPTFERRPSASSTASDEVVGKDRRTASEEIFMQQSHASLLARISELELALSSQGRSRSRPTSIMSDVSSTASSEPPDELLHLVADLKWERDELNRDIDGWRQRVRDLEHSKGVMERRLDAERRENWLKGEKLGLVEVEKENLSRQMKMKESVIANLSQRLETVDAQYRIALRERDAMHEDAETAKRQLADAYSILNVNRSLEHELATTREALAEGQMRNEALQRELEHFNSLTTPKPSSTVFTRSQTNSPQNRQGLGFQSVDSTSTSVDPDEHQLASKGPFTLKAVEEEECDSQDDEDSLAHYEDEEDSDISFTGLNRSSSFDSFDDDNLPHSVTHLQFAPDGGLEMTPQISPRSVSASPSPSPCPTPTGLTHEVSIPMHASRASLSKTWTFPRGQRSSSPSQRRQPDEVDRFFICLEDMDEPLTAVTESNKSVFSEGLKLAGNDAYPPFILPVQPSTSSGMLEPVKEEENDCSDFDCEEVEGGVKFVFSPPSSSKTPSSPLLDQFMDDEDVDSAIPFMFPRRANIGFQSPGSSRKISSVLPLSFSTLASPNPNGNSFATPKVRAPVAVSRIPPPSPPKFSTPKSKTLPPVRKAVPTFPHKQGGASTSASTNVQQAPSPKMSSRLPVFTKAKSANEPRTIYYRSESDETPLTTKKPSSAPEELAALSSTVPSTSSRFGFNGFNSFLSSGFSWTSFPSSASSTSSVCTPSYVSRDKQLSLLKQRIKKSGCGLHMLPQGGVVGCRNCDLDQIIVL